MPRNYLLREIIHISLVLMLVCIANDLLHLIFAFCDVTDDLNAISSSCVKLRSAVSEHKAYQVKVKVSEYFSDGRQPASKQELWKWFDILYNKYMILLGGETHPRRNLLFRPLSATFRRLCAIGVKRTIDFDAVFHHGRIYVLSGADGISVGFVESYDILQNAWSEEPHIPAALTAVACATFQGELYLTGGQDRRNGSRSTCIYSLANNIMWDIKQVQLQRGRSHHGCVFFQGKLWIAGGLIEHSLQPTDTVECVDMVKSEAITMPSMIRRRFRPRLYVINETLYTVGGDSTAYEASIERYDADAKCWELCCNFPLRRSGCASAVVGTRIYVFGGGVNAASPSQSSYDYFDVRHRWGSRFEGAQKLFLPYPNGFNELLKDSLAVTLDF